MGVVFGGDNIIDNVKVTNPNIIFANNDNSKQHLITAGGYVGAIVYGGVISEIWTTLPKIVRLQPTILRQWVKTYIPIFYQSIYRQSCKRLCYRRGNNVW